MAAKRLSPLFGIIVALFAASAAWLTGGALTLTSNGAGAFRIGIVPSLVWLGISLVAAHAPGQAYSVGRSQPK